MDSAGGFRLVAIRYVVALHFELAHPLAKHPVVPAVVARGAEVKACRSGGGDRQRPLGSVTFGEGDRSVG